MESSIAVPKVLTRLSFSFSVDVSLLKLHCGCFIVDLSLCSVQCGWVDVDGSMWMKFNSCRRFLNKRVHDPATCRVFRIKYSKIV